MIRQLKSLLKCYNNLWAKIIIIQLCFLGILGIWAIWGNDVLIYQSTNPDEIENIFLPAGTYRSYITYVSDCEDNAGTFISESDDQLFLADTLQFYSWENVDHLQLWALHDIPDVKFVYHRSGKGTLNIEQVSIAKTNDYKRMIWMAVLIGTVLFDLSMAWWRKIKGLYILNKKGHYHAIARTISLVLIGVIASYPLFVNRLIPAHDVVFHLSRIEGLKEGILLGQFPVRIQPTWFEGAGYAVSVLYGDLLLYFAALMRIMGFTLQFSLKMYIILITFGTIGCTYYALNMINRKANKWIAVLATMLYVLSLYRIGDVYIRQSLGEYTAMMFYPLVFGGVYRIFYEEKANSKNMWIMPMIGMTGILTSHSISAILVTFVLGIWCILELNLILKKPIITELGKTVLGTVSLTAGFLVPFIDYFMTANLNISGNFEGDMSYIQQHGMSAEALLGITYDGADYNVFGVIYIIIVVLLFAYTLYHNKNVNTEKRLEKGVFPVFKLMILFVLITWMSTRYFPWDYLEEKFWIFSIITGTIQFPFRFIAISMLFLSLMLGIAMKDVIKYKMAIYSVCGIFALLLLVSTVNYEQNILTDNAGYRVYDAAGLGLYSSYGLYSTYIVCGGEYIPQGVDVGAYRYAQPHCEKSVHWQGMNRHGTNLEVIVKNMSDEKGYFSVPFVYYKGYQVKDTVTQKNMKVFPGYNGMVTVELPSRYDGEIEVRFVSPWYWRLSEMFSMVMGIWVLVCLRKDRINVVEKN